MYLENKMSDIKAIDKRLHSKLKVKSNPLILQSKDRHFAPLVVHEFVNACQEFPIVFIKDSATGQFKSIALLGLVPDENLFFSSEGWSGRFIPQALSLYPFLIHQEKDSDKAILCFDAKSSLINETEGDDFFDDKGEQSEWLIRKGQAVVDYVEKSYANKNFIKLLLEYELLSSQTLSIKLDGQDEYSLNGLYAIDEKRLNELSDESFSVLRKKGALAAIYAALISMQNISNLANRKVAK
jgi:hypothetical protein